MINIIEGKCYFGMCQKIILFLFSLFLLSCSLSMTILQRINKGMSSNIKLRREAKMASKLQQVNTNNLSSSHLNTACHKASHCSSSSKLDGISSRILNFIFRRSSDYVAGSNLKSDPEISAIQTAS